MKRKFEKCMFREKAKRIFRSVSAVWLALSAALHTALPVFAAGESDPLTVIGNLSDFMFGIVRAVGMILMGFAIVQIGLSLKSHDPTQRANGFMTLAGGVIITFAKEILDLIIG